MQANIANRWSCRSLLELRRWPCGRFRALSAAFRCRRWMALWLPAWKQRSGNTFRPGRALCSQRCAPWMAVLARAAAHRAV